MEHQQNQNSNALLRQSPRLALCESAETQAALDSVLLGCFSVQKLYGREPESLSAITQVFHRTLAKYPADKVLLAFDTWLGKSSEFPAPADIVNLIKRNGKPPLTESQYIAISRKDGEDRTPAEWRYLQDYEQERDSGWKTEDDPVKIEAVQAENHRLRKELADLKAEYQRLANLFTATRVPPDEAKPTPVILADSTDRVANSVQYLRDNGVSEAEIAEFVKSQEVRA